MRILIDFQAAQSASRFRGIGRYLCSLVHAMISANSENEILLLLNGSLPDSIRSIRKEFGSRIGQDNIHIWYPPDFHHIHSKVPHILHVKFSELSIAAFIDSIKPDVALIGSHFEGYAGEVISGLGHISDKIPTAFVSYDLIPMLNPKEYLEPHPEFKSFYLRKFDEARSADAALCISENAREETSRFLQDDIPRIVEIGAACNTDVFHLPKKPTSTGANVGLQHGINKQIIFYCGAADSRKNLKNLVAAYSKLPKNLRSEYALVFAGKIEDWQTQEIQDFAKQFRLNSSEFFQIGHIKESELVEFYQQCALHVMPSYHEGFGLPSLEAMNCGAVSVGANNTSLTEVINFEKALFDPFDVDDMRKTIELFLTDDALREEFLEHAKTQVKTFSWEKVANLTFAHLRDIGRKKPAPKIHFYDAMREKFNADWDLVEQSSEEYKLEISIAAARSVSKDRRPRLYFDISQMEFDDHLSGIQRVSHSIMAEFAKMKKSRFDFVPVSSRFDRSLFKVTEKYKDFIFCRTLDVAPGDVIDVQRGDCFLCLNLELEMSPIQTRRLKEFSERGATTAAVLYDMIPVKYPEFWDAAPAFVDAFRNWMRDISDFDRVATISNTVKDDYERFLANVPELGEHRPEVASFVLGNDFAETVARKTPRKRKKTERITFTTVGTLEPRKRQDVIIDAMDVLWAEGFDVDLKVVGKAGWGVEALLKKINNHPEMNRRLVWIQNASDEDLADLYANSDALILASVDEGFGLPIIEASLNEIPVILRDIPVFREVAGDHAHYFAGDGSELAKSIKRWISLFEKGQHPSTKGLKTISWKECAEQLLKALGVFES